VKELVLELSAVKESVPIARDGVTAWIEPLNPSEEHLYAIKTVVTEAVANVVMHAYRDRPASPGRLRVQAHAGNGSVALCVEDTGLGMSPRTDSPGLGMGVPLIARLADSMEVICVPARKSGTEIRMIFDLGGDGAAPTHLAE
jgi:anti-sigma regulatory factor (Ser/Thr protein kinase)